MKNMKNQISRRHFLRGACGATMAIPFLPSLLSRTFAQDIPADNPHGCFFAMGTDHGNVWAQNMYPNASLLTQEMQYAGRNVRYGALAATVDGTDHVLSPVCRAPASVMTPDLVSKINILRGLDIPYRIGHHLGGHLGNFAGTVDNVTEGIDNVKFMAPTIDQVLAYAPEFYSTADLTTRMTQRSFNIDGGNLSWNYTSPGAKAGNVVSQPSFNRNLDLFQYLFDPGSAFNGIDTFLVDRIKSSYDRLKVHPRLSAGDRLRLDAHVERMSEIERKLAVVTQLGQVPDAPSTDSNTYWSASSFSSNPTQNASYCHLMNDMIVAAFSAGISRVGTWYQGVKFADTQIQDWHGQVAHEGMGGEAAQPWTVGWNRGTFAHVMMDLAAKMDGVVMENGSTLLDNSVLLFTQEAGQYTHHTGCVNYPIVMAGGGGGYFQTGMYVDFTNQDIVYDDLAELAAANPLIERESPGLYYNQFLANVLESMGVPKASYGSFTDFSSGDVTGGYGFHHVQSQRAADYVQARAVMDEKLPVITS